MVTTIKRLSEKEFQDTFTSPMRFLDENEESSGIKLKTYVQKILIKEKLNTTIEDIEIHYVYHTPDEKYEHILFNYGIQELYLVIINDLESRKIKGYHILDLIEKYKIEN